MRIVRSTNFGLPTRPRVASFDLPHWKYVTTLALCLLFCSMASAQSAEDIAIPPGAWRYEDHPIVAKLEGIPGECGEFGERDPRFDGCEAAVGLGNESHGQYPSLRYLSFVKDKSGNALITTDRGRSRAIIQKSIDEDGLPEFDVISDRNSKIEGIISFESEYAFSLSRDIPELGLRAGIYAQPEERPEHPGRLTFGNVFVGQDVLPNFHLALRCYDITTMNALDLQHSGCSGDIFEMPAPDSKRYRLWPTKVIPYGWRWDRLQKSVSDKHQVFASNSRELANAHSKGTGYGLQLTGNANVGFYSGQLQGGFHRDTEIQRAARDMSLNETMSVIQHSLDQEFVVVLDRENARLSERFRRDVERLRPNARHPINHSDFFKIWGTHYPYATTFGSHGYSEEKLNKSEMMALTEIRSKSSLRVDVSESGRVTLIPSTKQKKEGEGGGLGVGGELKAFWEQRLGSESMDKITRIMSFDDTNVTCVGGTSCAGSLSSAGENPIPIYVHLRPVTELLGPPFYNDFQTAVELRGSMDGALLTYLSAEEELPNSRHWMFTIAQHDRNCTGITPAMGIGTCEDIINDLQPYLECDVQSDESNGSCAAIVRADSTGDSQTLIVTEKGGFRGFVRMKSNYSQLPWTQDAKTVDFQVKINNEPYDSLPSVLLKSDPENAPGVRAVIQKEESIGMRGTGGSRNVYTEFLGTDTVFLSDADPERRIINNGETITKIRADVYRMLYTVQISLLPKKVKEQPDAKPMTVQIRGVLRLMSAASAVHGKTFADPYLVPCSADLEIVPAHTSGKRVFAPDSHWETCSGYLFSFSKAGVIEVFSPFGRLLWSSGDQTGEKLVFSSGRLSLQNNDKIKLRTDSKSASNAGLYFSRDGKLEIRTLNSQTLWSASHDGGPVLLGPFEEEIPEQDLSESDDSIACTERSKSTLDDLTIYFGESSTVVDPEYYNTVQMVGAVTKDCPAIKVSIIGHSDTRGSSNRNLELSRKRAEAVYELIKLAGFKAAKFGVFGRGETEAPLGSEATSTHEARRRVTFEVLAGG